MSDSVTDTQKPNKGMSAHCAAMRGTAKRLSQQRAQDRIKASLDVSRPGLPKNLEEVVSQVDTLSGYLDELKSSPGHLDQQKSSPPPYTVRYMEEIYKGLAEDLILMSDSGLILTDISKELGGVVGDAVQDMEEVDHRSQEQQETHFKQIAQCCLSRYPNHPARPILLKTSLFTQGDPERADENLMSYSALSHVRDTWERDLADVLQGCSQSKGVEGVKQYVDMITEAVSRFSNTIDAIDSAIATLNRNHVPQSFLPTITNRIRMMQVASATESTGRPEQARLSVEVLETLLHEYAGDRQCSFWDDDHLWTRVMTVRGAAEQCYQRLNELLESRDAGEEGCH